MAMLFYLYAYHDHINQIHISGYVASWSSLKEKGRGADITGFDMRYATEKKMFYKMFFCIFYSFFLFEMSKKNTLKMVKKIARTDMLFMKQLNVLL